MDDRLRRRRLVGGQRRVKRTGGPLGHPLHRLGEELLLAAGEVVLQRSAWRVRVLHHIAQAGAPDAAFAEQQGGAADRALAGASACHDNGHTSRMHHPGLLGFREVAGLPTADGRLRPGLLHRRGTPQLLGSADARAPQAATIPRRLPPW